MLTLKTVSSFPRLGAQPYTQVRSRSQAARGNEGNVASSQALAWEFSAGSSSFPSREAGASLTGFPSRSLGTSVTSITITQELK